VIDVRSGSEFSSGHLPGAVNIPMDQIAARLHDLRPGVPTIVCQTGKRARMTAGPLEPCQRPISVLQGGTSAWIQEGGDRIIGMDVERRIARAWSGLCSIA
jgi:rhodanese-related sulfurtransferase